MEVDAGSDVYSLRTTAIPVDPDPGGDMHEVGLAVEMYRTCREILAQEGGGRLETVKIAVGELSAVEPDALTFAWEAVTADGPDRGSRLEIEWRDASQRCPACGEAPSRPRGTWLVTCPGCGGVLDIVGGTELDILELSIESLSDEEVVR
jgi:hydrogenase nickel incorporation protein HypA/HybF